MSKIDREKLKLELAIAVYMDNNEFPEMSKLAEQYLSGEIVERRTKKEVAKIIFEKQQFLALSRENSDFIADAIIKSQGDKK